MSYITLILKDSIRMVTGSQNAGVLHVYLREAIGHIGFHLKKMLALSADTFNVCPPSNEDFVIF